MLFILTRIFLQVKTRLEHILPQTVNGHSMKGRLQVALDRVALFYFAKLELKRLNIN